MSFSVLTTNVFVKSEGGQNPYLRNTKNTSRVVRFSIILIGLVFVYSSVTGQERYMYGYAQNEIPQIVRNPVLANAIGTGVMSVTNVLSGGFPDPRTIYVTYHEVTGELTFIKKHTFPNDLLVTDGIVVNNEYHIVGLINRSLPVKNQNRGAFSMVIGANGNVSHYEEIKLTGSDASIEDIHGLAFNQSTSELFCTAYTTDLNASGNSNYTSLLKINQAGKVLQIQKLNEYTDVSAIVPMPNIGLYIFEGNNRSIVDGSMTIVTTDQLQLNPGEKVYKTVALSSDSVYLFTVSAVAPYVYGVILWEPSTDAMTRIMMLDDQVYRFQPMVKNNASYYLAATRDNRQSHYQLSANYDTIFTVQQVFGPNTLNGCNSVLICDQEIISYSSHPDTSLYYIGKSTNNWLFEYSAGRAPAIQRTFQSIFSNPPGNLIVASGPTTFTAGAVNVLTGTTTPAPVVIGYDQNCGDLFALAPTFVACNVTQQLIAAAPITPLCLSPNISRTYTWSNGSTDISTIVDQTGDYILFAAEGGCTQTDTITVIFDYVDIAFSGKNDFCLDYTGRFIDSAMVHVTSNAPVSWNSALGLPNDSLYTQVEGFYSATAVSALGCIYNDSMYVYEACDPDPYIFVPNAFTPDGDNINDLATASMLFIENVDFRIYNRWGQLVHQTSNPDVNWDGTFEGAESPIGIYVWIVDFNKIGEPDKRRQRIGHFCLVR